MNKKINAPAKPKDPKGRMNYDKVGKDKNKKAVLSYSKKASKKHTGSTPTTDT